MSGHPVERSYRECQLSPTPASLPRSSPSLLLCYFSALDMLPPPFLAAMATRSDLSCHSQSMASSLTLPPLPAPYTQATSFLNNLATLLYRCSLRRHKRLTVSPLLS